MELDFKSMKRKELQALCKKHGLPANPSNLKMAESLASLLQKKEHTSEEIKPKGCLKGSGGSSGEDVGRAREVSKKVSFSLEEDKPEFEEVQRKSDDKYSPKKRRFSRRRSAIAFRPVKAIEEDEAVEVPARTTQSRSLAVAVMWSPGVEKKKGRKRMEAVCQNDEPPQVVKLPSPNKRNRRKAAIELSHDEPTTRTLRNRVVVVREDEGLVRDSKPRKAQTKRTAKEKNEASIAPLLQEATIAKELENDEVFGGKSCPKHNEGAVSVEEIDAYNGSEMVPSCEEPPLRRSKRIRKLDNNLEEGKRAKGDAVAPMIRLKNSINGSLQVSVTAVNKSEKQVAEETEMAPQRGEALKRSRQNVSKYNEESGLGTSLPACVELKDECVAVAGKISSKKRRKKAPNGSDLAPSVPDGDMLNDAGAAKVHGGKLCEHKEPPRRSTRSSSMHRILDHGTNDVRIVGKNEPMKQKGNVRTRRGTMKSSAPSSEIEISYQAQESQGESQRGSQPEEGLRHLRCNASEYSMPDHKISLPDGRSLLDDDTNKWNKLQKQNKPELGISLLVGGKSVDDETYRRKNLQKRQRGQILGKPGPKASVLDCKTGVDAESLEENESSKEPQMKFKHNAAKSDSCSDTVPVTLADQKQKYEKNAEIQTVGLQVMEAKITHELLSCNHPEVLSAAIVEGDSSVIFPNFKIPGLPAEVHDVGKMASQVDSCLQVDASDNQERTVQLSTVVAGSDFEDTLNQQKVCRNGMVNCGAAEDTMLNSESTPKESDDVKQCRETSAKPSDAHISEIAADEGKDNSTNFSLFINSGEVGFLSGESNFEENIKDEITQSFPLNVCSDEARISYEDFPKGDSDVMQSGSSSNVMDFDSVEQIVKYRELSPSKLVEVTCGINETIQEVKEKSKTSSDGYLHAKNEEQITIQVNSIISEEQEEALDIGLDKGLSCSKVREVQSEISDLVSERPEHSNVEAVVHVESMRDSASQGNLNVDNNVAILSLDDGCIYRKQDEVQDALQVTDLKSSASTIVANNNENPVDAFQCENSNKRNEARGFGGVILSSTCLEDLPIVTATESSSWIDNEETRPAKQENVYDAIGVGSDIDGSSPVHPICGLDCNEKDLLSLQRDSRVKMRSGGVASNAMLVSQSEGVGCDVVSIRKNYLLDDTGSGEHLPDNQKDSKSEGETCGAVSSDIYSHNSAPGECEVLGKFKEDLMEDNWSQFYSSISCKVLPEQSDLELCKVELQETNETNACGCASDDKGAPPNESVFAQTILEKRDVVDAGETVDSSNNQKITLHVHQVSTDSLTKIINIDSEGGGDLRDKHAVQKARLDILDGIVGDEGEVNGSVGNKENTARSDKFDGEVVHKPESAACKEIILSPEHVGSVEALRAEQGPLSYKQNVKGIDQKEASKILVRKFDWRDLEGNEAFKDKDAEEKLDAKLNCINCNEVDDIVSAENVHSNGAGGTLISITPSIPEYTLEKSEHALDNSGKLPIAKRAHEVLSALKSEVDEASFIMRLLIGSKDLITQDEKAISPNDAVDEVGFTKIVCKNAALDEAKLYCSNSSESLCSNSKNDKAVLTSQFDLKDHGDDNGIQYLKTSGLELDCGRSEDGDISGKRDWTGTSAGHLSCKSCKQDIEKVTATFSEGKFSSCNKAPFFCVSSESKSDDVWDAPGAKLIVLEDLFQMESEVSYVMNDKARAAFCESQSDEEKFEHETKDSMDIMSTDEDKASGKSEEMVPVPPLSDVLFQREFGGQADTAEKNGGLHARLEALGCENSCVVGTVSGSAYSDPADRMECQVSIQVDEQKMLCREADIIDKCEGVKPVDFCHAVLTEGNAKENYATDGYEDQEREETLNPVSPLISGTGVDEKACSLDCMEITGATGETKIQDAAVSRSLLMVQGEAVLESCTESFQSPFIYAESEGRENTFADEVAGKTSIIEAAEFVSVEESKSKEIWSSAAGVSVLSDETVRLNSSDFEIVNSCDAAAAKQSKHEENSEDFGMSMVETVDLVGLSQQSPMGFTGGIRADYSPAESEIGLKSDALEPEESSRCSRLDQMEDISGKLLNFRISSAKKACKTGFYNSTPMKLVENSRFHSMIDGSKGKENTPIIKMDHSYKHNLDKSAITRSSRRPLQSLPK
uniref:LOW QUALITY PROTEIN: uncharacterized protein LOC105052038 n=1 Tax=Elaeis guineensis var. tenera TaxID=51953 RepID=A0A6I9RR17_ELAGV|nr:LOW QUALITY PROTEIN: uncharacterized protein LOC105052038 [Elaeis guineensis]